MRIIYKLPAIAAFSIALAFSAAPKLLPIYFQTVDPGGVRILGNLKDFKTSSTDSPLKEEVYRIPVDSRKQNTYGIGNFLYDYQVDCIAGAGRTVPLAKNIFSDLQSNLNNYVTVTSPVECEELKIVARGPKQSVRLHTGDGPLIEGNADVVSRIEWLNEFFVVSMPIFLAFIFFVLTLLYGFTEEFNFGTGAQLARYSLTSYSIYFILQAGFFSKFVPAIYSGNFSSKINAYTAVSALTLGIASLLYTNKIETFIGKKSGRIIAATIFFVSSGLFFTSYHREILVLAYATIGVLLLFFGLKRKNLTVLFLGIAVGLDSLKMGGYTTPFISRTSWFYVSNIMILDCTLRLYGMSRIFSVFSKAQDTNDVESTDLMMQLDSIAQIFKDQLHFSYVGLRFLTKLRNPDSKLEVNSKIECGVASLNSLIDLKYGNEIQFGLNHDSLGTLFFGESFLTNSDLPSSSAIKRAIVDEISWRAPALFSNAFNRRIRKFDFVIEALEKAVEVKGATKEHAIEFILSELCVQTGIRVVLGDYVSLTHQVKVRFIRGFPVRVEERWLKGFLRATPENQYGPLARGIHGKSAYIVPDVEIIKPYIHENTVDYYREANTRSCFAIPLFDRNGIGSVAGVLYGEASDFSFDEGHRVPLEKLGRIIERLTNLFKDQKDLQLATTALSRFIPRTHVFALINGSQVVERDRGYLLMIDLKGSTKFSLAHGSDAWLARVEVLQKKMGKIVESFGMILQTFSWDAAFITSSTSIPNDDAFEKIQKLSVEIGLAIEAWAQSDSLLRIFWRDDPQKARFCVTFGDISRGLAHGTTETWTVTGESMAVIAKMEAECKKIAGVFFCNDGFITNRNRFFLQPTGVKIRSLELNILFRFSTWSEFLEVDTKIDESKVA